MKKRVLTMLLALVKQCRALEKKIYEVEAAADKLAQDMDALPDPTKDSREQYAPAWRESTPWRYHPGRTGRA